MEINPIVGMAVGIMVIAGTATVLMYAYSKIRLLFLSIRRALMGASNED